MKCLPKCTGYLKNHWTKHGLVCTHFVAFFMLIPNMDMILTNSEIYENFMSNWILLSEADIGIWNVKIVKRFPNTIIITSIKRYPRMRHQAGYGMLAWLITHILRRSLRQSWKILSDATGLELLMNHWVHVTIELLIVAWWFEKTLSISSLVMYLCEPSLFSPILP